MAKNIQNLEKKNIFVLRKILQKKIMVKTDYSTNKSNVFKIKKIMKASKICIKLRLFFHVIQLKFM